MSTEQAKNSTVRWTQKVQSIADGIRWRVLDYTLRNNGGYLSQACSSAELLATLYAHIMKLGASEGPLIPAPFPGVPGPHNPKAFTGASYNGPRSPQLDRFFFSPVHYALVLYATLIEVGRLAPEGLEQFNRDGSTVELIGAEHSPGHEITAGSLGQTLSVAGGVALARKLRGHSGRCWVFMSDGEFQEGQTWEALAALAYHQLDNVGIYVDVNGYQCDGKMDTVMVIEPLLGRLRAFGANAVEVDGHDIEALAQPTALPRQGKPLLVLARTDPCRGIDLLQQRKPKLHYVRFASDDERSAYQNALAQLRGRPAGPRAPSNP